ncbi:hypothetical protein LTR56_002228 [Elasticomyces elasticus]|nr:hypothetical protein LTR56_002228 [Elasticomyces elasticus]KAK3666105.1 hypothetical protein LTR22_003111 [Elasticomyces elasticus]KAK4929592.1 hypothetical protein LTR49_003890 [Elasticomyces elasticus]KAK5767451.1 hypothetical protein LTS12_002289 [Elasticomyces elasticus]
MADISAGVKVEVDEKVTPVKAENEEQKAVLEEQKTASGADEKKPLSTKTEVLSDEQIVLSGEREAIEGERMALSEEKKAFEIVKAAFEVEKAAFTAERASQSRRQTVDCGVQTEEVEVTSPLPKRKVEPASDLDQPIAKRQRVIEDLLAAELATQSSVDMRATLSRDSLSRAWSQHALPGPSAATFEMPPPSPAVKLSVADIATPNLAANIPAAPRADMDVTEEEGEDDEYSGPSRVPRRVDRKLHTPTQSNALCQFVFVNVAGRRRYFAALSQEVQARVLKDVRSFYLKGDKATPKRYHILELTSPSANKTICAGCRAHGNTTSMTATGPACGICQSAKRVSVRVAGDGSADPELVALPDEKRAGLGPDDLGYYVVS